MPSLSVQTYGHDSDFNETWIFSPDLKKNTQISNMKIHPLDAKFVHADLRT